MVEVETHWIGTDGEPQSVTRTDLTDKGASFYAENIADSARDFQRRAELFELDGTSSVQCVYDDQGNIWRAIIYTEHIGS